MENTSKEHFDWEDLPGMIFRHNWNNKLFGRSLTSIRRADPFWYDGLKVALLEGDGKGNDRFHGVAAVVRVEDIVLSRLTDFDALQEMGYLLPDFLAELHGSYKAWFARHGKDAPLMRVTLVKCDGYYEQHDAPYLEEGRMPIALAGIPIYKEKPKVARKSTAKVARKARQGGLFG
jgi:hypothetical protein